MVAGAWGSIPPRRPDQYQRRPQAPLVPPAGPGQFQLLIVSSSTGITGFFFYSPFPGPGNLVYSITAGGVTSDPYGNTVVPGASSYFPGTGQVLTTNAAGLIFQMPTDVFHGTITVLPPTGGSSGVPSLNLLSPSDINSVTNDSECFIGATGRSADGTVGPYVILGSLQQGASNIEPVPIYAVGGLLSYAAPGVPGGSLVPEPFHQITSGFPAGWSGKISYKFLAELSLVFIDWALIIGVGTAVTNGEVIATIPAAYLGTDAKVLAGDINGGGVTDLWAPAKVQTSGSFTFNGAPITPAGTTSAWRGQAVYTTAV